MRKLSKFGAKLTGMKLNAVGLLAATALAGVVLIAGAPAAQAQFRVGVQLGGPRYYAPPVRVYGRFGYGYGGPVVYGNGYYGGYGRGYGDGDGDGWRGRVGYGGYGYGGRGWGGDDRRGWGGDDRRGWGGGDRRGWGGDDGGGDD